MPDSFLYQPHVHTADGVLTPDLVVDHLALVVTAKAGQRSIGINLLTMSHSLQDPAPTGCGSAALVFVSGGRGAVATVGSAHWDPTAAITRDFVSEQLTPKPIAREGVRLARFGDGDVALSSFRRTRDGEIQFGRTRVDDLPDIKRLIGAWSGASAPRRAAIFISARHADPEPESAIGYRVVLTGLTGAPDIEVTYGVERLRASIDATAF